MYSKSKPSDQTQLEGFVGGEQEALPNTDIPNQNYPKEYPMRMPITNNLEIVHNQQIRYTKCLYGQYFTEKVYPQSSGTDSFTSMTGQKVNAEYNTTI